MNDDEVRRVVDLLSRRRRLLDALGSPTAKSTLVERLDASRSTVERALRDLATLGLVERTDDGYRLTLAGRLLRGALAEFRATVDDTLAAETVLGALSPDAPLDARLLRGAAVRPSAEPAPHEPLEAVADLVRGADRLWGLARAVTQPRFPELFHDRVLDGLDAELVYEAGLVEEVLVDQRALVGEMVAHGFRAFRAERLPFGLVLTEDEAGRHVAVTVYDEAFDLRGVVRNDADRAVAWGRECYEAYRADATEITREFAPRD